MDYVYFKHSYSTLAFLGVGLVCTFLRSCQLHRLHTGYHYPIRIGGLILLVLE